MPFIPPEVRIGNKDFNFYTGVLMQSLLEMDMDTTVKAIGTNSLAAVNAVNWVYRKLRRTEFGVVKVRYGEIKIGKEMTDNYGLRPSIEIPCRVVTDEVEGYRAPTDLNTDPWSGKLEYVDDMWRDILVDIYFRSLANNGQMNLCGTGEHLIDAMNIFNIMQRRMTGLDVNYEDVEIGYKLRQNTEHPLPEFRGKYSPCIKIVITAKEKEERV
jgi:DNA-binding protein